MKEFSLGKEWLMGMSTLEAAKQIVFNNPDVEHIHLRGYRYIPDKISDRSAPILRLTRTQFLNGNRPIGEFLRELKKHETEESQYNIALDSKALTREGMVKHFPMVDLHPEKCPKSQERIMGRFKELIVPYFGSGLLLATKKSYHYLGEVLMDEDRYEEFLGRCLTSSIVTVTPKGQPNIHEHIADYRYVGHSLIRGTTGLRITTRDGKSVIPKVVTRISP